MRCFKAALLGLGLTILIGGPTDVQRQKAVFSRCLAHPAQPRLGIGQVFSYALFDLITHLDLGSSAWATASLETSGGACLRETSGSVRSRLLTR